MNKSPADWSRVSVDAAMMDNTKAEFAIVLRMALEDIAEMAANQRLSLSIARKHAELATAEAFDRGFERGRQREMMDD